MLPKNIEIILEEMAKCRRQRRILQNQFQTEPNQWQITIGCPLPSNRSYDYTQ
jgi:hypothetical protein